MKLAICSTGELYGGVERHIVGMVTWLMRQGENPLVVLFHDRDLAGQLRGLGCEPVVLAGSGSFDFGTVRRLGSLLAENDIDVVHAHGYKAVVNCALARRHHRFAMVRTVHGLVESKGWWTRNGFKSHVYTRLERFFGRRAGAAVVYVTEDLRQRHAKYDRGLVTKTIHNGIDPLDPADYSRPTDLEEGKFHLLAVGRVTRIKGLEFAIRAVAKLEPELNVVLNIIGTGPLEGELKTLAAELKVEDRVRFLGFKKNVYDYMAHGDALVMPSLHEGLPYTILEAMSLGLPIIASRVGGLAEVLDSRGGGETFDPQDLEWFTKCLRKTFSRIEGDFESLGEGQSVQRQEFTMSRMGAEYFSVYRDSSIAE